MHIAILQNSISPADRIVVPKSDIKMVKHHAIYLGQNDQGVDLIIENNIGIGVKLTTADEFFMKSPVISRVERFTGSNDERRLAVERALVQIGRPYNLINYNCESFSNHVQHNVLESKQVKAGFAFAGLLILLGLAFAAGE